VASQVVADAFPLFELFSESAILPHRISLQESWSPRHIDWLLLEIGAITSES